MEQQDADRYPDQDDDGPSKHHDRGVVFHLIYLRLFQNVTGQPAHQAAPDARQALGLADGSLGLLCPL
jgi:hypothetical protein